MPQQNKIDKTDKRLDKLIALVDKGTVKAQKETDSIKLRMAERHKRWRLKMAESDKRWRRKMAENREHWRQEMAQIRENARLDREKLDAEHKKLQDAIDATNKQLGDFVNSEGLLIEDEFCQALQDAGHVGKIDLDYIVPRLRPKSRATNYDLVGFNGDAVVVGEVKRTLSAKKIIHFAQHTLPQFVHHFPSHHGKKIYGLVAAKRISPNAEKVAADYGLFIATLAHRNLTIHNGDGAKPMRQTP